MMGSAAMDAAQQVVWVTHGKPIAPRSPAPVNGFCGGRVAPDINLADRMRHATQSTA